LPVILADSSVPPDASETDSAGYGGQYHDCPVHGSPSCHSPAENVLPTDELPANL